MNTDYSATVRGMFFFLMGIESKGIALGFIELSRTRPARGLRQIFMCLLLIS